jgi:hypothetical protein
MVRMKKFIVLLSFLFVAFSYLAAQSNGNGGGNGYWNGNGNNGNGGNTGVWAGSNWPQWVINWLENGGQVPIPMAMRVTWQTRQWGQQTFGLNYGQMVQKYFQGDLTITYLPTTPPTPILTFRVSYGGGILIINIEDI